MTSGVRQALQSKQNRRINQVSEQGRRHDQMTTVLDDSRTEKWLVNGYCGPNSYGEAPAGAEPILGDWSHDRLSNYHQAVIYCWTRPCTVVFEGNIL